MKNYTSPSVVEFGKASEVVQGCGGWGLEGWTADDSDRQNRWVYTDGWYCICTTLNGSKC